MYIYMCVCIYIYIYTSFVFVYLSAKHECLSHDQGPSPHIISHDSFFSNHRYRIYKHVLWHCSRLHTVDRDAKKTPRYLYVCVCVNKNRYIGHQHTVHAQRSFIDMVGALQNIFVRVGIKTCWQAYDENMCRSSVHTGRSSGDAVGGRQTGASSSGPWQHNKLFGWVLQV